jgi:OTU domain-containing protein 6
VVIIFNSFSKAHDSNGNDEVMSMSRKEIKELQNREIALKKVAAKGSKAEQKAKKKQVEEEILRQETRMRERHTKELWESEANKVKEENSSNVEELAKAFGGITTSFGTQQQKPSKAQKRRDKRANQEAEREQRIQDEQNNVVSERMVENELLENKLRPLGLALKEMKPDGHCLYRAIEDQLALYPDTSSIKFSFQKLREVAASYMRSHAKDFAPFVVVENTDENGGNENAEDGFERYCQEVESTASWGGHLELDAIARSLQKHIVVYSSNLPEVEIGKQYGKSTSSTLRLSYHRHAFGLGEHYNSVVPLVQDNLD